MSNFHTTSIRVAMISVHGNPLVPESSLGSDGKGGQNVYVREVGTELSKLHCDVTWFTRSESPDEEGVIELSPKLRCQYIVAGPQMHIHRDFLFEYLPAFADQIDIRRFDVLLTNYWLSGYVGRLLQLEYPIAHAHVQHSIGKMKYERLEMPVCGPLRMCIEDLLNARVDCSIHQTKSEMDMSNATFPALITDGINTERFKNLDRNIARDSLGFQDDVIHVLYVGRFAPNKGIPFAIEALKSTNIPHKFRLIGNNAAMESLVASNPDLDFLGSVSDAEVALYMAASDILIMPSLYEPFGLVAIEAMAAGCCLIVSATLGLDKNVKKGVNGYKVPPGDAGAILEAFEKLVANPSLMEDMRRNNKSQALKSFSWRFTASQIVEQLEIIVARKLSLDHS